MLTTEQKATLKAFIQNDTALNTLFVDGNLDGLAAGLNDTASPVFTVWRTRVEKKEVVQGVSREGTSFIWAGNGFIGRTAGEIECWNQLFNSTLTMNPSLPNVRQAFLDVFSGTGNAALNRTHMAAVAKRDASVIEKLFATGTGTLAAPATMVIEGPLGYQELVGL
jgi:hypothetical protein